MNSCRLAVIVFVSKFKTKTLCALELLAWAVWMLFSLSLNLLKSRWFFQNPLTSTARIPTGLALLVFLFFSGVYLQFIQSVVSDSWRPHESQHSRPPCPSLIPVVHPNPCPLSQWRYPTISSSVIPFSSCLQSFPRSGSFQMSQFFTSGGQSIGVSATTWVLPVNTQDWSPLGWTGWTSLESKGPQESSPTPQFKSINSSVLSFLHSPTLTCILENHSLD